MKKLHEKGLFFNRFKHLQLFSSERPYFNQTSQVINALEGTSVSLHCDANGHPKPTVEWTMTSRNGSRTVMTLSNQDTLNIMSLDPYKDYGTYTCTASSALGAESKTVQLNVYRKLRNDKVITLRYMNPLIREITHYVFFLQSTLK